jgi:hypothetical protein
MQGVGGGGGRHLGNVPSVAASFRVCFMFGFMLDTLRLFSLVCYAMHKKDKRLWVAPESA